MSTVLPDVVDGLIAVATAGLTGITILDGFGNTDDPGDYLMVGVDDPNTPDLARGGRARSDWRTVGQGGSTRREEGSVTCAAMSWNGEGDLKSARDSAFATVAALETSLKTDPTIGGRVMFATTNSHDYIPAVGDTGAEVIVVFTVSYVARI